MVEQIDGVLPTCASVEKTSKYRRLKPYSSTEMKVLLLENIHPVAIELFKEAGFQVEVCTGALSNAELAERLKTVHALGIRSKTAISDNIIQEAPCLLTIGCFCIGTNHVSLDAAINRGISVFNSPFSNSRSVGIHDLSTQHLSGLVAELVIGKLISLARNMGDRNIEMHKGLWNKSAKNCCEIRGKTLGIVGYGHIGSQLSVLAESMGMTVIFYDITQKMPLGTAKPFRTLKSVLEQADFVSIHVPETENTIGMISHEQISWMKNKSFLINDSRGSILDISALKDGLKSGKLAGAALDVYPEEPETNGAFCTGLEGLKNVILTPHIGGSTEEAQKTIGLEVAHNMIRFINQGTSLGSVNFPEIDLRLSSSNDPYCCRVVNVHQNVPGVLRKINEILSEFNIEKQICESKGHNSYVLADVTTTRKEDLDHIFERIYNLPESKSTRIVY